MALDGLLVERSTSACAGAATVAPAALKASTTAPPIAPDPP